MRAPPAAVLLAAGESTRMGSPKALLVHSNAPATAPELALPHIAHVARSAGCATVVAVLGRDAAAIRAALGPHPEAVRFVTNPAPELGRTRSLKLGLQALAPAERVGGVLLWPVDHPSVATSTVQALIAAAGEGITVPRHGDRRGHPIVLGPALLDETLALPDDRPLRDVVHRDPARVHEIATNDPGVLLNLDTPADAHRAGWQPAHEAGGCR